MIKTPTNQKLLTNVAVVRMKKCGKRFVDCEKRRITRVSHTFFILCNFLWDVDLKFGEYFKTKKFVLN